MNFIALALTLPHYAPWVWAFGVFAVVLLLLCLPRLLGIVYIPHTQVGMIEKIWSSKGSLREGQIIARNGEAGFQARFLRGGIHFGLYPWQYRIHKEPLVVVAEGKMAYVYARDGVPLEPVQTLGRNVECNHFQDAMAFLETGGQRGRQRGILREGVYAINLSLFVVITEDRVFSGPVRESADKYELWKAQLLGLRAFDPVVIGSGSQSHFRGPAESSASEAGAPPSLAAATPDFNPNVDTIGVVSIQDGPTIGSGEIIAPEVKALNGRDHNYFQDPEAFLELGGKRGKQLQVLTDGTFSSTAGSALSRSKPRRSSRSVTWVWSFLIMAPPGTIPPGNRSGTVNRLRRVIVVCGALRSPPESTRSTRMQ